MSPAEQEMALVRRLRNLAEREEVVARIIETESYRKAWGHLEMEKLRERVTFLTAKCNNEWDANFEWVALLARSLPNVYAKRGTRMRAVQDKVIARLTMLDDIRQPTGNDPRDPAERWAHIIRLVKPRKKT